MEDPDALRTGDAIVLFTVTVAFSAVAFSGVWALLWLARLLQKLGIRPK